MKNVSVIIPAYNESDKIRNTIKSVKSIMIVNEIIVVDDGSSDNTLNIAKEEGVNTISTGENKGKGKALTEGLKKCNGDIIVFLDADVGETAKEIKKLIVPICERKCDVAIGRFPKPKKKGGFGLVKFISKFGVKKITGKYIESVLSGQRAFRAQVLKKIKIADGYGAEVGMTIDILKMGYKISEYDVSMIHNETGRDIQGFIHRGKQMIDVIKTLISKIT